MSSVVNLIVGAGVSGLTLAREFTARGETHLVIEKSRGVGGRMATRRDGDARFDHGAQFYIDRPELKGIWEPPAELWLESEGRRLMSCAGGMTQLAKKIQPTNLALNEQVAHITKTEQGWRTETLGGRFFEGQRLFLTCPLPQSLHLLRDSGLAFSKDLHHIRYHKALVGLFILDSEDQEIQNFRYAENVSESLFFIANQMSKKVSPVLAFSVGLSRTLSDLHFEQDSEALQILQTEFSFWLNHKSRDLQPRSRILQASLKKWRFASPCEKYTQQFVEPQPGLYLLGDAFGGPSLSGAYFSAQSLIAHLRT